MAITKLTKEEAEKAWPEKIRWLEENNIQYEAYNEWIPSTGENGSWIYIEKEIDAVAFKLRWL